MHRFPKETFMFNAIANAMLKFAPELNADKVLSTPSQLKSWFDESEGNGWRESKGAKCQVLHCFDEEGNQPVFVRN